MPIGFALIRSLYVLKRSYLNFIFLFYFNIPYGADERYTIRAFLPFCIFYKVYLKGSP